MMENSYIYMNVKIGDKISNRGIKHGMVVDYVEEEDYLKYSNHMKMVYLTLKVPKIWLSDLPSRLDREQEKIDLKILADSTYIEPASRLYVDIKELEALLENDSIESNSFDINSHDAIDCTELSQDIIKSVYDEYEFCRDLIFDANSVSSGNFNVGLLGDYATWSTAYADIANLTGDLTFTAISITTETGLSVCTESVGIYTLRFDGAGFTQNINNTGINFNHSGVTGTGVIEWTGFRHNYVTSIANTGCKVTFGSDYTFKMYDNILEGNNKCYIMFYIDRASITLEMKNNIIRNNTGSFGLCRMTALSPQSIVENNTFADGSATYGIDCSNNAFTMKNNAIYGNLTDIKNHGNVNGMSNLTEDLTGTDTNWGIGVGNVPSIVPSNEYNADYSPRDTLVAGGGGTKPSIDTNTRGIDGKIRPHVKTDETGTAYSIGAKELKTIYESSIGTSNRDYANIQDWQNACPTDLVASQIRYKGEMYNDYTFNEVVSFAGVTTDSTYHEVLTNTKNHSPILDRANKNGTIFSFSNAYVEISKLEIRNARSESNSDSFVLFRELSGGNYSNVHACKIHDCDNGGFSESAISVYSASATGGDIKNCKIYRINSNATSSPSIINIDYIGNATNNTIYNCKNIGTGDTKGITNGIGTAPFIANNIVLDVDICYTGSVASGSGNNISSDATASGVNSLINKLAENIFKDVENLDFTLSENSEARNTGLITSGKILETDFDGYVRLGDNRLGLTVCDIGAFEYFTEVISSIGSGKTYADLTLWITSRGGDLIQGHASDVSRPRNRKEIAEVYSTQYSKTIDNVNEDLSGGFNIFNVKPQILDGYFDAQNLKILNMTDCLIENITRANVSELEGIDFKVVDNESEGTIILNMYLHDITMGSPVTDGTSTVMAQIQGVSSTKSCKIVNPIIHNLLVYTTYNYKNITPADPGPLPVIPGSSIDESSPTLTNLCNPVFIDGALEVQIINPTIYSISMTLLLNTWTPSSIDPADYFISSSVVSNADTYLVGNDVTTIYNGLLFEMLIQGCTPVNCTADFAVGGTNPILANKSDEIDTNQNLLTSSASLDEGVFVDIDFINDHSKRNRYSILLEEYPHLDRGAKNYFCNDSGNIEITEIANLTDWNNFKTAISGSLDKVYRAEFLDGDYNFRIEITTGDGITNFTKTTRVEIASKNPLGAKSVYSGGLMLFTDSIIDYIIEEGFDLSSTYSGSGTIIEMRGKYHKIRKNRFHDFILASGYIINIASGNTNRRVQVYNNTFENVFGCIACIRSYLTTGFNVGNKFFNNTMWNVNGGIVLGGVRTSGYGNTNKDSVNGNIVFLKSGAVNLAYGLVDTDHCYLDSDCNLGASGAMPDIGENNIESTPELVFKRV